MKKEYAALKAMVEVVGFFTTFQPIRNPGDRIVCASRLTRPVTGVAGWEVAFGKLNGTKSGLSPPGSADLPNFRFRLAADLRLRLLRRRQANAYMDFDRRIRQQFGLIPVPVEEFRGLRCCSGR